MTVETKRGDKSDFEIKRLQEKLSAVQTEKDRLAQDLQNMKENHEEMELVRLQGMSLDGNAGNLYL